MADQQCMAPYTLVPRDSNELGYRLCVEGHLRQFDSASFILGLRNYHAVELRSKQAPVLLLDCRRVTDMDGPAVTILMTAANIFGQMAPPCVIRIINLPERFREFFAGCTAKGSHLQIGVPEQEADKGSGA
jgi:anti-anti-sigma regulatory factor